MGKHIINYENIIADGKEYILGTSLATTYVANDKNEWKEMVIRRKIFCQKVAVPKGCKISVRCNGGDPVIRVLNPPNDRRLAILWQKYNFSIGMLRETKDEILEEATKIPRVPWAARGVLTDAHGIYTVKTGKIFFLLKYRRENQLGVGHPVAVWMASDASIQDALEAVNNPVFYKAGKRVDLRY